MENANNGFITSRLNFPIRRKAMFPSCTDRKAWEQIASDSASAPLIAKIRKIAQKAVKRPIPELRASEFILYRQNGNRSVYEKKYFEIRQNLEMLVLAECLDGKGEYLSRICDYVWAICSEPCWTIPAHCAYPGDVLPPAGYTRNDLFASATGLLLAFTLDMVGSKLEKISVNLTDMIKKYIIERIIVCFENTDNDIWYDGHNNWTVWCSSNILGAAAVVLENDPERFEKTARRLAGFCDLFYQHYSDDGACDEGPVYWGVSPVKLCLFIELAISAGILAPDIYYDSKLRAMISYIADMHLGNGAFFSYSDSGPHISGAGGFINLLAKRLNDKNIAVFARQLQCCFKGVKHIGKRVPDIHSALTGNLLELFNVPDHPYANVNDSTVFYRSRGYLAGRCGKIGYGLKGGNNHECHNQNDVGHFVIAVKGKFAILDLGSETYSRQYFSESTRYNHISCNASGHNMPLFNGIGEINGPDRDPQSIEFKDENGIVNCTLEAAGTYPDKLALKSVKRSFSFERAAGRFIITDSWVGENACPVECNFFSAIKPQNISDKIILLGKVKFSVDRGELACREFEITDNNIKKHWRRLWQIKLIHSLPEKSGCHTITIDVGK